MRKLLVLVTLFTTFLGFSQNLDQKIPASAETVISINGDKILDLVSIDEFNKFVAGREILKNVNRKRKEDSKIKSLNDLGFNLDSKAYYYYQATDSISYHVMLIKLKSKQQFESLLRDLDDVEHEGNLNIKEGWSDITVWNDNALAVVTYTVNRGYIDENKARLNPDDESSWTIKKAVGKKWAKPFALNVLNNKGANIAQNSSFKSSLDANASAVLWVKNYSNILKNSLKELRYFLPRNLRSLSNGDTNIPGIITTVTSKLYFDKDAIRSETAMQIAPKYQEVYNKIYKSKIDKRFFNYFDQNNVLGYISISANSEELLNAYPQIATDIYGGIVPGYREEVTTGAELMSLLLDEKAIGELLTGDMLFITNDIKMKEVTYTTYQYDEDYNSTEVTKTKKSPSPEFTILIGSENKSMLTKFASLGVKHHLMNQTANYYKFKLPKDVPFDFYAVIKDGMLVLTSSKEQMAGIASGRFKANAGKHKKLMRKNASVMYVNTKAVINNIPTYAGHMGQEELEVFNYVKENLTGDLLITSKMKGDKFYTIAKIDTPENKTNALNYIFNFIEDIYNITQNNKSARYSANATREAAVVVENVAGASEEDVEVVEIEETVMEASEVEETVMGDTEVVEDETKTVNVAMDAFIKGLQEENNNDNLTFYRNLTKLPTVMEKENLTLYQVLQDRIKSNAGIETNDTSIYISFKISKNGTISDIKAVSKNKYLEKIAIKTIKDLKLNAGESNDEKVNTAFKNLIII